MNFPPGKGGSGRLIVLLGLTIALSTGLARAEDPVEEIVEKTYPIEPNAKFRFHNDDGSIRIYGADIDQMKLQAIKRAYSIDRLHRIEVNVSAGPGEISIETLYPPKPKWGLFDRSGTVDYVIFLPWKCNIERLELINGEMLVDGMRGTDVHAHLENGRFFCHNCFTDLHVSVQNGGLDVGFDWWENGKFSVDAEIADGNARAFIPVEARCHLTAETPKGHVFSDFIAAKDRHQGGVTRMDTHIGGNSDVDIQMRARDGSIKIGETYD